eukprot:TRINITY_DN1588_c0_g1_i2.p1 TRINITY_DN1588_c0_g1~~TRINITY_DN1588_c0_g1_i2.p1  ORF type:complete len:313 (-),score=82.21 TRINITY_DN1588_c0_g1_i2:90-1028(-)
MFRSPFKFPSSNLYSQQRNTSFVRNESTQIKKIGVIGSGQMGTGIAQVAAQIAKIQVVLVDKEEVPLTFATKFIDRLLAKDVAKEKITQDVANETMKRISTSTDYKALSDADLVVEAVSEVPSLKFQIFSELSKITPPHAILASNTSSISITKIARSTNRPEKVIGMHFMNPVPVMQLVEIIPGMQTSKETLDATLKLAADMKKITTKSNDMPGFIANRLLMPYINEACQALMEGVGTKEDIDTTMKLGTNVPMGPLTLADFIGLDTCLSIMKVLHVELGDSKYRPSPLLVKYVEAGWLGKKTKRGFYTYDK